jgi:endonuclease G, mitochondrial
MVSKIIFLVPLLFISIEAFNDLVFINNSPFQNIIKRVFWNYEFTTWVDCDEHLPVLFHYITEEDVGNFSRSSTFRLDPILSTSCQQKSTNTYNQYTNGWDRGHMVPANHLDHSLEAIKESNYMTNIAPQTVALNRGAWQLSEEIIECWRDNTTLNVFGGVIFTEDTSRDYFMASHGVRTPFLNWKVVVKKSDDDIIAWIMPNDETASRGNLDRYLTSLKNIEETTGFYFTQFTKAQKEKIQPVSWVVPKGCDLSK